MKHVDFELMRKWRREFHQYPEIGWAEFVTTSKIMKELKQLGYEVFAGTKVMNPDFVRGRTQERVSSGLKSAKEMQVDEALMREMEGFPGCMGVLDTGKTGPTIAFRFDMDCVNVQEINDPKHFPCKEGFSSTRPGLMHACGHDGHSAIGLGMAQWLVENKVHLNGRFKLVFQPAEEGVMGARPMVESGIFDDVDYLIGLHLGTIAKKGEVSINPQGFMSSTKIDFTFKGEAAHAGSGPEKGRNALAGACSSAMAMLAAPRHSEGDSRVNVGIIQAGEGRNVVPASAKLQVEVRGQTQSIMAYFDDYVTRCAEGAALTYELEMHKEIMGESIDLVNSERMIERLARIVEKHPELKVIEGDLGGGEDVTFMVRRVQERGGEGIFFIVGADLEDGHHKEKFDFNEDAMQVGADLLTELVQDILQ